MDPYSITISDSVGCPSYFLPSMHYGPFPLDKHKTIATLLLDVSVAGYLQYTVITDSCMTVPRFDMFQCCLPPFEGTGC